MGSRARSGEVVVKAEGLKKSFGSVVALDGVDLAVKAGTVLALLGPNGAGKTTLVRILTTLSKPDSGYAQVAGYDVVRQAAQLRAAIGLAGQQVALDDYLTGRENLQMVANLYHLGMKKARRRAAELLSLFDLNWAGARTAKAYSGGMRRRLDLAASLVGQPQVLFLDEPTTGLDPKSRNDLWEVIEGLVSEGTTLVLTTQYLEEADRLADAIAVVNSGKIVAYGTASELKSQIGGEMLEVTLAHRSDLPRAIEVLKKISTGEPKVDAESLLVAVAIQSGTSGLMEALRGLDQAGVEVGDMGLRRPTLDDVFLTLTAKPVKLAPAIRALQPAGEPDAPLALPGPLALPPLPLSCCDEAAALGAEAALAVPRAPTSPPGRNRARHIARSFSKAASDFAVIGKRNLLRYIRLPNLLVASAIQPVMIVLLFTYVFGGVMKIYLHGSYIDYLMPGVFTQAVLFDSTQTGIGLAQDLTTGMFDRFRSLPIARSAVLGGRTLADGVRILAVVLLMAAIGILLGFRFHAGALAAIAGLALAVAFGISFSWLSAVIGLLAGDVESAQAASFVWILPLTFASSAFVPIATMPGWLQAFAKADPVSHTADALRSLFSGGPVGTQLWESVAWLSGILAVCVPVAVRLYRRAP